ncbi:hypothetical protein Nepgr_013164 [Nepenthes gracilis]|uniref:Uncharacterized protein n=1 Tax=Nepenthes gracilis TaxID=150966 RepID=A0AAD3XNR2_NEPGR|nr:hypothetical protein Nepgr_013164 [Nepenthes gracilis]
MEEHKLRYLGSFLKRNETKCLEDYIDIVKNKEENVRQSYAESSTLTSNEFIEMVLVDSAFIIELFLRSYDHKLIENNDRIFNKPRMIVEIAHDLMVEENQLPYFILKELYDFACQHYGQSRGKFIDVVCKFFNVHLSGRFELKIKHFVDLLRSSYRPSLPRVVSRKGQNIEFCPSIIELEEAGVLIVAKKKKIIS